MAVTTGYFDRKNAGGARPGVSQLTGGPKTPLTPQRVASSAFSSPGVGYRAEEDHVIFEVGARHICAGFAGDSRPRCTVGFGKEQSRRIGDYRKWLPGYNEGRRTRKKASEWSTNHELWCMDTQALDLRLFEDKFERAVREAYGTYLLLDSKSRRVLLVIPSLLPHPLLASMLSVLFNNFQIPSIMLLPSPHLTTLAAGQRSALVVDIGWHETLITAIYEFREIRQSRSTRAGRMITLEMGKVVSCLLRTAQATRSNEDGETEPNESEMDIDFDHVEDIAMRLAWCNPGSRVRPFSSPNTDLQSQRGDLLVEGDESLNPDQSGFDGRDELLFAIPRFSESPDTIELPMSTFRTPVESVLFALPSSARDQDDEEQAIHHSLYDMLTSLSADVRCVCMANIIITGGGSNIPGVKSRTLSELTLIVQSRGWDPVWGKAADKQRKTLENIKQSRQTAFSSLYAKTSENTEAASDDDTPSIAAAFSPQENIIVGERLACDAPPEGAKSTSGTVRGVESLGAWAGGSLAASTKIKAVVEIEREAYIQHGMAGAKKESELNTNTSRQSMRPSLSRTVGHDSTTWTLSAWA